MTASPASAEYTAFPTPSANGVHRSPGAIAPAGPVVSAAGDRQSRVVSVSAHDVAPCSGANGMVEPADVFPAPRIIDSAALDRVVGTLQRLVESARSETGRLASSMEEVAARENRARDAAKHLQDRLALGARMLKAFGAQIERMESLAGARDAAITPPSPPVAPPSAELEARINQLVASAESRMEQSVGAMMVRFERDLAARAEIAEPAAARLRECLDRADEASRRSEAILESLRPMLDAAESAAAGAGRDRAIVDEVRSLLDSAAEQRRLLHEAVITGEEQVESVEMRMSSLRQRMLESTMLCEARAAELEGRMAEIDGSTGRMSSVERAAKAAEDALARLGPWESVLAGSGAEALADRARHLATLFRETMAAEMRKAAAALLSDVIAPGPTPPAPAADVSIEVKGHFELLDGMDARAASYCADDSMLGSIVAQPAD